MSFLNLLLLIASFDFFIYLKASLKAWNCARIIANYPYYLDFSLNFDAKFLLINSLASWARILSQIIVDSFSLAACCSLKAFSSHLQPKVNQMLAFIFFHCLF